MEGPKLVQTTLSFGKMKMKDTTQPLRSSVSVLRPTHDVPILVIIGKRDSLSSDVVEMDDDENKDMKEAYKDTAVTVKSYNSNRNDILKKQDIVLIGDFQRGKLDMFSAQIFEAYGFDKKIKKMDCYHRYCLCEGCTNGIALIEAHRNRINTEFFSPSELEKSDRMLREEDISVQIEKEIFSKAEKVNGPFVKLGYIGQKFKMKITSLIDCYLYCFSVEPNGRIRTFATNKKQKVTKLTIDASYPCTIKVLLSTEEIWINNANQEAYDKVTKGRVKTIDYFYNLVDEALVYTIQCQS